LYRLSYGGVTPYVHSIYFNFSEKSLNSATFSTPYNLSLYFHHCNYGIKFSEGSVDVLSAFNFPFFRFDM
ncbi:MAG: hypothetical protein QXV40_03410, partial [Thermoplasmatales archaeon]